MSARYFSELQLLYWHVYVLGGAYFLWPWKSRAPHRDIVTSQLGHWPLLIRVSGITWRSSKLLEASRNVNIGTRYVCTFAGAGSGMGGEEEKHTYCCYAYWLYFLTCDMCKSSLRHIHDSVLSSLKMKGILSFCQYYRGTFCRSQCPRGLRYRSAAARLLRSWVLIPPGAWMFVCCECCVLSGRGLCDELITRPEES
jgi:hypothetical protein